MSFNALVTDLVQDIQDTHWRSDTEVDPGWLRSKIMIRHLHVQNTVAVRGDLTDYSPDLSRCSAQVVRYKMVGWLVVPPPTFAMHLVMYSKLNMVDLMGKTAADDLLDN